MCIACFIFSSASMAQTDQGKFLVGVSSTLSLAGTGSSLMSLGFSTMKYKSDSDDFEERDPDKETSFNLLPKVGYFVIDNLAVGLDIGIGYSNTKSGESGYKYETTMFSVGPFIRYYFQTKSVLPFIEADASFGGLHSKNQSHNSTSKDKYSVITFGGGLGIAVPIGNRVTFDVMAGYNSLTVKDKEDNEDNDRMVYGTFGVNFGFIVLLGKE